jgi:hypothetical protein
VGGTHLRRRLIGARLKELNAEMCADCTQGGWGLTSWSRIMTRRLTIVVAAILASSMAASHAEEKARQLSCSGSKTALTSLAQAPVTIQLTFVSPRKITINLGNGDINSPVISDNDIQLKFQTDDFVGELFHNTNNLFLIYESGDLAKLACKSGRK